MAERPHLSVQLSDELLERACVEFGIPSHYCPYVRERRIVRPLVRDEEEPGDAEAEHG